MRGKSEAAPYLPMVKDIAPNAPIGAKRMIKFMILKRMCEKSSMADIIVLAGFSNFEIAMPKMTAINKIGKISPSTKALKIVVGMMLSKKSTKLFCSYGWGLMIVVLMVLMVLMVAASMFMPLPGFMISATITPIIMAMVVKISK